MRPPFALFVCLVAVVAALLPAAAQPTDLRHVSAAQLGPRQYSFVALSSFGGTSSGAISINNASWVSGFSFLAGNQVQHAALWLNDQTKDLGTLGGPNSSIAWPNHNNLGKIVGYAETAAMNPYNEPFSCIFGTGHVCQGFVWQSNVLTALPTLGGYDSYATDINDWGQIVGWAENTVHDPTCVLPQVLQFEAVIWEPNLAHTQPLQPYPGDADTAATAINDSGEVVGISGACDIAYGGTSAKNPVYWQHGIVTRLGTLGGSMFNTPAAVNQFGQIVGWSDLPGDTSAATQVFHAVLWTRSGNLIDLGTLPGDKFSLAYAINDWGQIVGQSIDASGNSRAFLWENGQMTDLNSLVREGTPALVYANDINDRGEIVGGAFNLSTNIALAFEAIPSGRWGTDRSLGNAESQHNGPKLALPAKIRMHFLHRGIFGRMDSLGTLR